MGDNVSQAVGDPGLEQAMSGWEDSMEQQWQGDPGFFADEAATQAAPTGGINFSAWMPSGMDPKIFDEYGPYGQDILSWDDVTSDQRNDALELAAEQWTEFKEMAETFGRGGSLEDLNMTRKDFKQWAGDAVYAPNRPDSIAKNIGKFAKDMASIGPDNLDGGRSVANAGTGFIPPNMMKALRTAMRASLK